MQYRRCGNSGILLSAISIGLWQNFGATDSLSNCSNILHTAFDHGITHFDLANNYGPPPGAAETTFGKILQSDFHAYRDELIISTKAGYTMWPGPYGDWGSKKYLVASLNQSLKRTGLSYVDIFYHHRPDPNTPLIETMTALDLLVRQGKTLYIGLSNYPGDVALQAFDILKELGTPCLVHQPKYSMFVRTVEESLLALLEKQGIGCVSFSPLAQGLLTNKYLLGVPADSRAGRGLPNGAVTAEQITHEMINRIQQLNAIAQQRNQSLAQMALAWILKDTRVTSVLLGVSKPEQITDSLLALNHYAFSSGELLQIDTILNN